ncbi:MAG: hypothetical protein KIH64_005810, partial [Mycobacterium sp.]|nr:hypothetical protein [Mycobacterium sp.]
MTGTTPIEQLLRVLGIAANLDDPRDNATGAEQHAERDARTLQAAEAFAVRDGEAAAELESIAGGPYFDEGGAAALPDQTSAMAQQLPQLAAGIAGSLAGALGGVLQPLTQIPQQAAQGMQQLAQTGLGMFQQSADEDSLPIADSALAEAPPATDFGAAPGD